MQKLDFDNINYRAVLADLETKINDLKIEYENYFMGNIKREPILLKNEVDRILRSMMNRTLGKTALNFKLSQLTSRYNTYKTYWTRIVTKIENGTYERDKFKLALKDKQQQKPVPVNGAAAHSSEPEENYQKLYNQFLDAKISCNERIDDMQYEKFKSLIVKQCAELKSKYNYKSLEFRVAVEDGKTKIKVVPIKQ